MRELAEFESNGQSTHLNTKPKVTELGNILDKDDLPPNSEAGCWYDWKRQHLTQDLENKKKIFKLKKKANKLTKKSKVVRRK